MTVAPQADLSAADARLLQLSAQGLARAPRLRPTAARVAALVRSVGAVQLDTISVLARSHELVVQARLGPTPRPAIEAGLWGGAAATFEYWSHAACILPLEDWPWSAIRRRHGRERLAALDGAEREAAQLVRSRLRTEGAITTQALGGARTTPGWWEWSPVKVAVERMLTAGEVVVVARRGWRRVYDLAERVVPAALLAQEPDDATCRLHLVRAAARRLGVGTLADLADYHRQLRTTLGPLMGESGLVPVRVQGWRDAAWADPDVLEAPVARRPSRTTLLSPFDSLVWDRARAARVFGFTHRLEAYVPAPMRVHGYFVMPLLHRGRLCGRVDPVRQGSTLVARRISADPDTVEALATALREAAAWVSCDHVVVERVSGVDAEALRARLG